MEKLDEGLKTLLELGKRRGFLTFDQVNDYLPDEASSPEKIHGLLESLEGGERFCGDCGAGLAAASPLERRERRVVSVLFADLVGFTRRRH